METKPYNLQSPEQIAKDYGGNKQKIAEAMQMGVIDPTAGTLAGMFIDRMRSAAQTEAAPQQSVAQQVFAPPMPPMPQGMPPMPQMPQGAPAGLGATPEAAAMPALAAAPPMGMPSPQAVPGMAAGGMVPPYMGGGGLSDLPVPDDMFDEPRNGGFGDGYRGGGLVAFSGGTGPDGVRGTADDDEGVDPNEIVVTAGREEKKTPEAKPIYKQGTTYLMPEDYTPFAKDIPGNIDIVEQEAPLEVERAKQYQAYLDRMLSPEEQKARRREDMFMALGQIGARMASTPGSLLQAASAGISEALPGIAASAKERRAEERAAQQALVGEERIANKELETRAGVALDMLKGYNSLNEALQNNNFRNLWESLGREAQIAVARISGMFGLAGSRESARANMFGSRLGYQSNLAGSRAESDKAFGDYMGSAAGTIAFNKLVGGGTTPADALASLRTNFFGGAPSATTGTPPPPSGYKPD